MSRVAVSENILRWALKRSDRTVRDLQKRFPRLEEWIAGKTDPTLRQLESLAKATQTPLGYFFLSEPPEEQLPMPHFRTIRKGTAKGPSPNLLETVHIMQRRQSWMRENSIEQGQEPISFVNTAHISNDVNLVAKKIREALGFSPNWASKERNWTEALRTLRESIECAGIMVVVNGVVDNNTSRKLDPEEFKGFVLVDDFAPLVFVNGTDGKASQMFTLAHELAHLVFGSSAAFDLRNMLPANDPTELACNQVAAEFLVPEQELRQSWPRIQQANERFQYIASQFKVSSIVGARRALDLKLISKKDFLEFYAAYQIDDRRKAARGTKGGNFYLTQNMRVGRRFASAIIRAAREGKLLYSDAFRLTSLHGKTFENYATSLGLGGG